MNGLRLGIAVLMFASPLCGRCDEAPVSTTTKGQTPSNGKHFYQSFLGEQPTELKSEQDHWVNGTEKLTLQQLHGKVVWLEFNF